MKGGQLRNLKYGKGGALALTVAAVVLLSGIWSMWLSPVYDNRKYEELQRTNTLLNPNATVQYSFETAKGQEINVSIDPVYVPSTKEEAESGLQYNIPASISAAVYDANKKVVMRQESVTNVYTSRPLRITEGGTYLIEVTNNQNRTFTAGIVIIDATNTPSRALEPMGQWLSLISLPIFALGIWLFIPRREQGSVPA